MVDFVSVTADVDRLARDVTDGDFNNTDIQNEQKAAYSKIGARTHKYDWGVTPANDPRLPGIKKIEQQLAASYIIEYYGSGTPDEIAMIRSLRDEANDSLTNFIEESSDLELDETINILNSNYESYPASLQDDPNAIPYRSTNVSV